MKHDFQLGMVRIRTGFELDPHWTWFLNGFAPPVSPYFQQDGLLIEVFLHGWKMPLLM